MNIEADIDEIFGSAYCAAYYMKNNLKFPEDKQVYVVGMSGICEELESMNIKYCGSSNDNSNIEDMAHIGSMKLDENVGAVLLGFDLGINYKNFML